MVQTTSYIDPWFTRNPKTKFYCFKCQKDLKPGQKHRFIACERDVYEAIHADNWEAAKIDVEARSKQHIENGLEMWIVAPVGLDCARKIGLEFTRPDSAERCMGRASKSKLG